MLKFKPTATNKLKSKTKKTWCLDDRCYTQGFNGNVTAEHVTETVPFSKYDSSLLRMQWFKHVWLSAGCAEVTLLELLWGQL